MELYQEVSWDGKTNFFYYIVSVEWRQDNAGFDQGVLTVERLIVMYARNINRHTKSHSATCVHFVILGSFYAA